MTRAYNTKTGTECGINCASHDYCINLDSGHAFWQPMPKYHEVINNGLNNEPTIEPFSDEKIKNAKNFEDASGAIETSG